MAVTVDGFTYYDIEKIDKRGALFNAIVSARTGGKTFQVKLRMISEFLEKGNRFVYVRRRDKELEEKKMRGFFEKIQEKGYYKDRKLEFKKGFFYLDDEMMGYSVALSTSVNERSVDFVNVSDIYFEEFVIKEDWQHRYLDNEVFKFLELYSTIARNEEVRVWFIGNKIREFNPYFLYFDIIPPKHGIKVHNDFAVEVWKNDKFVEERKNTRFGRMIAGTSYSDYAIENQSYEDNSSFICPLQSRARPFFNIEHLGNVYTVFYNLDNSMHISDAKVDTGEIVVTDSLQATPKKMTMNGFRTTTYGRAYVVNIRKNRIYYTSSKVEEVGKFFNKKMYFGR